MLGNGPGRVEDRYLLTLLPPASRVAKAVAKVVATVGCTGWEQRLDSVWWTPTLPPKLMQAGQPGAGSRQEKDREGYQGAVGRTEEG